MEDHCLSSHRLYLLRLTRPMGWPECKGMSLSLYLDCCALQRPFDDRSQLRVATEAEAVLKLIELFEKLEL